MVVVIGSAQVLQLTQKVLQINISSCCTETTFRLEVLAHTPLPRRLPRMPKGYLPAAFRPLPNLVTLSHCDVANMEAGSLMAITLCLRQGGDLWKLAFALEVVAFGGVEADRGSLLGGALPFLSLCSKRFVGLKHEVADPRQFEAVAVSDTDGGSLMAVGFRCRTYRDDALYQATQDQQGCSFDGRALLDFIRDSSHKRTPEKSEEEEELEEFVNFVRYWDLVKHRGKGCRSNLPQPSASKGSYSQVGFSYDGNGKEETHISEDDDEDFNSDDSNNEGMEVIAKEYGVKRYGWLVYMDKKAKEEEKR
ncbi:hypothetical protein V8G54_007867 [Vigna mungo]|uniref:Suppressor of white apricot N-terminal domain-containing protein n=1 Tax=Vigna mungo TaxID=3915 RepID=A0AAQ3P443_VIGMU